MTCEICGCESKINSHNEIWCTNCAMLVHACKCPMLDLTNEA